MSNKAKGASFERDVCKRLSLWVSNLSRQDVFWRSAMSGGRATIQRNKMSKLAYTAQSGDVAATHWLGDLLLSKFVVECKHYKSLDIHLPAFGKGTGLLIPQWQKTLAEATADKKLPMMVVKQNRQPMMVLTNAEGLMFLTKGKIDEYEFAPHCCLNRYDIWMFQFLEMITEVSFDKLRIECGTKPLASKKKLARKRKVYALKCIIKGDATSTFVVHAAMSNGTRRRLEFKAGNLAHAIVFVSKRFKIDSTMIQTD